MIHLQDLLNYQEVELPFNHIETRVNDFLSDGDRTSVREVLQCLMDDDNVIKNVQATLKYVNPHLDDDDFKLFSWWGSVPAPEKNQVRGFLVKVRGLVVFHRPTLYT